MTPRIGLLAPCQSSVFDRSLCFCAEGGIMHTYSCELPDGHSGEHRGHDTQYGCGPSP